MFPSGEGKDSFEDNENVQDPAALQPERRSLGEACSPAHASGHPEGAAPASAASLSPQQLLGGWPGPLAAKKGLTHT